MPVQPVRGVGTGGIVMDIPAVLLPETHWSDGRNVRFDNASVSKISGHIAYAEDFGQTAVHWGIFWNRPTTPFLIYANPTDVYRQDSAGNIAEISTGSTYASGSRWHGSLFTGGFAVVMNNTVDTPQYIIHGNTGAAQETRLVDLPGWNYTPGTAITAGIVRPFRNHLVAGNLTAVTGGVISQNPATIRISTAAAPGLIPTTWEPGALGDASTADEFELSQTEAIVDMKELRGHLFVYTGDSIHQISIGQAATIASDYAVGYGCLAVDCIAAFDGQHFVVDRNDMYVHSGSGGIRSVVDGKMRDYFYGNLNATHFANTFVSVNRAEDEIWVCYPTLTSTGNCDEALIWNYRQDTWTIRDIPNVRAGFQAPPITNDAFMASSEKLIVVGTADAKFFQMDTGTQFDGVDFTAYVERKRFDPANMIDSYKYINKIYLTFDPQSAQATMNVAVRGQNGTSVDHNLMSGTRIENREFKAGTEDYQVNFRESGRLLNMRIGSSGAGTWELAGYALDVALEDKR